MVMRIAVKDHQNKSAGLVAALSKTSCTSDRVNPEILFIDHDAPEYYHKIIDKGMGWVVETKPQNNRIPGDVARHGRQHAVVWISKPNRCHWLALV
jgi:hypothetical protein